MPCSEDTSKKVHCSILKTKRTPPRSLPMNGAVTMFVGKLYHPISLTIAVDNMYIAMPPLTVSRILGQY